MITIQPFEVYFTKQDLFEQFAITNEMVKEFFPAPTQRIDPNHPNFNILCWDESTVEMALENSELQKRIEECLEGFYTNKELNKLFGLNAYLRSIYLPKGGPWAKSEVHNAIRNTYLSEELKWEREREWRNQKEALPYYTKSTIKQYFYFTDEMIKIFLPKPIYRKNPRNKNNPIQIWNKKVFERCLDNPELIAEIAKEKKRREQSGKTQSIENLKNHKAIKETQNSILGRIQKFQYETNFNNEV